MLSDTAESVSKGVFVYKGTKKKAKSKDYFNSSEKTHRQILDTQWNCIHEHVQNLQTDLNKKIFADLVHYVASTHRSSHAKTLHDIPTAALITGINLPDHEAMFSTLVSRLHDDVTRHVAVLRSKDCVNIRLLLAQTLTQIIGHDPVEDDENVTTVKTMYATFGTLTAWYKHQLKKSPKRSVSPRKRPTTLKTDTASPAKRTASPRKRLLSPRNSPCKPMSPRNQASENTLSPRKLHSPKKQHLPEIEPEFNKPPIVFILEDLEGFSSQVLQDFVTICSNYMCDLPIVLVFGIATAVTTIHRLLPSAVSSRMCIECFQAPPSSQYLTMVIDKILMTSDLPFKLSDKVFTLLLDLFLFHDFSVLNFNRNLQLAMVEHFYGNPNSILCQPLSSAITSLHNLDNRGLQRLLALQSVASYIEGRSDKDRRQISQNKAFAKDILECLLVQLHHYHVCFFPVLRCLHVCTSRLAKYPLGKQVREMYCTCLATCVCSTEQYKHAVLLLRMLSRNELLPMVRSCLDFLSPHSEFADVTKQLQAFANRLENVEELAKIADIDEDKGEDEDAFEAGKKSRLKLHDLKQKLQAMEKKKKKQTVYEIVRNDIVDILDKLFNEHLQCPQSLPLHEAFYFNNVAGLRQHINAAPRATIQRALAKPYCYLKSDTLQIDNEDSGIISSDLPDICIVYKLHLECGRLINLYDWMQAFAMIVQSEDEEFEDEKKIDKVIQARFIRAVSELQFLGFIRTTKRKTDHVARLTWGGC